MSDAQEVGVSGSRQWAAAGRSHESRLGSTGASSRTGRETMVGRGGEHQSEKRTGKRANKIPLTYISKTGKIKRVEVSPRKEHIDRKMMKQSRSMSTIKVRIAVTALRSGRLDQVAAAFGLVAWIVVTECMHSFCV